MQCASPLFRTECNTVLEYAQLEALKEARVYSLLEV